LIGPLTFNAPRGDKGERRKRKARSKAEHRRLERTPVKHSGAEQRNKMPGNNKNHGGERKNAGRMPAFVKGQQTIFGGAVNAAKTKKGGTRQKRSEFL
jgi:hypothetical protein